MKAQRGSRTTALIFNVALDGMDR